MTTIELAATVVAGTALVLAPIDPQPIRDLNTPPAEPQPEPATPESAVVANYDNHGSFWGYDTLTATEAAIASAGGATIDEWHVTDRNGHQLRIVRIQDPAFLDTISVIPA
ncbi:hypothetical protein ACIQPQ_31285 [Streptomyces sp. NPDC091281]|uniref:hypothetical protein n=1 Tax=Streptomyces sp. NPDC091281 TaxID=3365985 RepID=UPI00380CD4BF